MAIGVLRNDPVNIPGMEGGRVSLDCPGDLRISVYVKKNDGPGDPEGVQVTLTRHGATSTILEGFGSMSIRDFLDALGLDPEYVDRYVAL